MVDTITADPPSAGGDTTPPASDEKTFNAYAFLNDMGGNADMKTEWTATLTKVKATFPTDSSKPAADVAKKGLEALDNVIAEWGYDTTAVNVLSVLKAPFWQAYQNLRNPNDQSDRFVQDLMSKPDLSADWSRQTGAIKGADTSPLDAYLKAKGYDCNAQQVSASFDKMRNQNLNYWTGVYGNTTLQLTSGATDGSAASGSAPAAATVILGPALTVYGSGTIGIGALHAISYTYARGQLAWSLPKDGDDPLLGNKTAASITFSQLSQPRADDPDQYVGNIFSGTLTVKEAVPILPPPPDKPHNPGVLQPGTYSFSGKVGPPPAVDNKPVAAHVPASVNPAKVDSMHEFLSQVLFYGGLAMMAHFVLKESGISSKISAKLEEMKGKSTENADTIEDNFEGGGGGGDKDPPDPDGGGDDEDPYLDDSVSDVEINRLKADAASADDAAELDERVQDVEDRAKAADEAAAEDDAAEDDAMDEAPDNISDAAEGAGADVPEFL